MAGTSSSPVSPRTCRCSASRALASACSGARCTTCSVGRCGDHNGPDTIAPAVRGCWASPHAHRQAGADDAHGVRRCVVCDGARYGACALARRPSKQRAVRSLSAAQAPPPPTRTSMRQRSEPQSRRLPGGAGGLSCVVLGLLRYRLARALRLQTGRLPRSASRASLTGLVSTLSRTGRNRKPHYRSRAQRSTPPTRPYGFSR